jgi:hypothetical protein
MVPFFGSHITQNTEADNRLNQDKLEVFTGNFKLRRDNKEISPKQFPPINNLTNVYGTQLPQDRELDRIIPNNIGKKNNEVPIEKVYVGPGLADGYTARPSGGFHNQTRILPKKPEDLYINSKAFSSEKTTNVNAGQYMVTKRAPACEGGFFKNRPTLIVTNLNGERNFTTTGEVTKPMARSTYILQNTEREWTSRYTQGPAKWAGPELSMAIWFRQLARNRRIMGVRVLQISRMSV